MDRLAIEFICAMGLPPDRFVHMAADLGVTRIGIAPGPITDDPHGYGQWDLRTDPALRRATKAALADRGVLVAQGEGFLILPGADIGEMEPTLDIMAELGAPAVNSVIVEQDRARAIDQFAKLAAMAQDRGQFAMIEFMPMMKPGNLADTLAMIGDAGAANGKVMLDAMHFYRSGSQTAELAAVDPALIGHIQLCDVPMPARSDDYGEEARHERMCPGDGDLPLSAFLAALPRDVTVGLEIPMISKARAGIDPVEAIRPCVAAARELLAA